MIEIKNLVKKYNKNKKNEVVALDNVSLTIEKGEMVAITGKSGAGKSTLLHIIGGVLPFDSGSCIIDGKPIENLSDGALAKLRNEKVGTVFQNFLLLSDNSVAENVEIPLVLAGVRKKKRKELCCKALESVGIAELSDRSIGELSGGQKQRVAIARAIVNDCDYILADEPTGSLDSQNTEIIFNLFRSICDNRKTVIIVTHDLSLAEKCDRQIILSDGRL